MSKKTIKARIQHLCKTESEWNQLPDFVPKAGELIIYQTNSVPKIKIGDGKSRLRELDFVVTEIDFDSGRIEEFSE